MFYLSVDWSIFLQEYGIFQSSSLYPAPNTMELLATAFKDEQETFGAKFEEGRSLLWVSTSSRLPHENTKASPSMNDISNKNVNIDASTDGLLEIIGRDGYVKNRVVVAAADDDSQTSLRANNRDVIDYVDGCGVNYSEDSDQMKKKEEDDPMDMLLCSFIDNLSTTPTLSSIHKKAKHQEDYTDNFNIVEASLDSKRRSRKLRGKRGHIGEEKRNVCLCGLKGRLCLRRASSRINKTMESMEQIMPITYDEQRRGQDQGRGKEGLHGSRVEQDSMDAKVSYASGVSLSNLFKKILNQLSNSDDSNNSPTLPISTLEDGDSEYVSAKSLLLNDSQSAFYGSWRSRSRCVL